MNIKIMPVIKLLRLALLFIFILSTAQAEECPTKAYRVQGTSMVPVIQNGDLIHVTPIVCYTSPLKKGDIILVHSGADKNPLIKNIKAVAGDTLAVKPSKEGEHWSLYVNDILLKNSLGLPYSLANGRARMLKLYQGVLKEKTFLIMGEGTHGTTDSSRFGLVHQSDIIGILKK